MPRAIGEGHGLLSRSDSYFSPHPVEPPGLKLRGLNLSPHVPGYRPGEPGREFGWDAGPAFSAEGPTEGEHELPCELATR